MAFGIRLETDSGRVQIDSDTPGSGILVTNSGTGTSVPITPNTNELRFARPSNRTVTSEIAFRLLSSTGLSLVDSTGATVTCDWVTGVWANSTTVATTGDYGIQVNNSDGDLAFDSRAYNGNGGFGITNFVDNNMITAAANNDPNNGINLNTRISNDINAYYLMNPTFFQPALGSLSGPNFFGYVFRPATGVHWLGRTITGGFGFPPTQTSRYSTNPTVLYGEAGSV